MAVWVSGTAAMIVVRAELKMETPIWLKAAEVLHCRALAGSCRRQNKHTESAIIYSLLVLLNPTSN